MSNTAVETELECPECGATETASGNPFDKGRLNRHIQGAHPDLWEEIRDEEAVAPQTRRGPGRAPKNAKPVQPPKPKQPRQDITAGLQANIALVAMIIGGRSPYKGAAITSFAPKLAETANASAQAGPDWYYQAFAMASTGGAHMDLVVTVMALAVTLAAEKNEKHRDKLPLLRAVGMPVPPAPWEDPSRVKMPTPPPARPVMVDLDNTPGGPAPAPQAAAPTPPTGSTRTAVPEAKTAFAPGSPADTRTRPPEQPTVDDAPRQVVESMPNVADFMGGMGLDLDSLKGMLSEEDMQMAAKMAADMLRNGGRPS